MHTNKNWIFFLIFILIIIRTSAQCPDFTDLNDPHATCYYGTFSNPFEHVGIIEGRHTVITQQGTDTNTRNALPFLPFGEDRVIRLGNDRTGAEAEAISFEFTVDPAHTILLIKFAVVLENPRHPEEAQPRFVVQVLDSAGERIESCAGYDVTSADSIPGFQIYTSSYHDIQFRPWTTVGIDLANHAGQTVKLQFITYDCNWHGHFGYAYFTASCTNSHLTASDCHDGQITFSAPLDFETYLWDNGDTYHTTTYNMYNDSTANCQITTSTGCTFVLSATFPHLIEIGELPPSGTTYYDTICEGEEYHQHFFNLPPQYRLGTSTHHNSFYDPVNCSEEGISTTLFLTVRKKYYFYEDIACQGDNYDRYGFHYINLQPGEIWDTNIIARTGCDSITILHLTTYHSFHMHSTLIGDSVVCEQEVASFSLPNASISDIFHWNIPSSITILYGQSTPDIGLYFTSSSPNPATITLTGENGCGSGTASIEVTHHPSYHLFFQDTICAGNEYLLHGFHIARQDNPGLFQFTTSFNTSFACDSVHVLQLLVTGTPEIRTMAQPTDICDGESSTIYALNVLNGYQRHPAAVGDILCTDSSIIRCHELSTSGKTPWGVVFYVDRTGEHGWAVKLRDDATSVKWSTLNTDIAVLTNYSNGLSAMYDGLTDSLYGYHNTELIRNAGTAAQYPAAYAIDFNNGWYIPAAGQLCILYSQLYPVNRSLSMIPGAVQLPTNLRWSYWSSTECDQSNVWNIAHTGCLNKFTKSNSIRVRSIRNF